ncbi:DNA-binding protein [Planomicrobium chinense]|uniref:DNA-binding protein n=1 Tax=Planococcus chinensis TaxID=272917 RepID=UPI001CC6220E|nr:DNA-binding protein [Planococcus chinensis]MBZ5202650.1 DNA-binding protein [Planococcus chinensis]MCP2035637.1 ERCC4-type nuclease [Planomicrobium sp. HSC-17F08]
MAQPEIEHSLPHSIGRPATNALLLAGFTHLEQFTTVSEKELLKLHGVGPKAVRILREALHEKALSFSEDAQ